MAIKPANCVYPANTRICVTGLESAAQYVSPAPLSLSLSLLARAAGVPRYNGRWGQITATDQTAGRYAVDLGQGQTLRLKYANAIA